MKITNLEVVFDNNKANISFDINNAVINDYSSQGWELVETTRLVDFRGYRYIFKRDKNYA